MQKNSFKLLLSIFILCFCVVGETIETQPSNTANTANNRKASAKEKKMATQFGNRKDVQRFIWDVYQRNREMYQRANMNAWEITKLFKNISSNPKVLEAMSRPFEEVTWGKYKERFLGEERARAGVEFWKKNEATLKKAEKTYGVPAEIIVAIIGVETFYGKNIGIYPVLQTLATLAFDYPPRSSFFKQELEQFMILMQEEGLDPYKTYGSYAGAMGIPQFIPSSYRKFAVDFTNSGKRNLISNTADAIGSVANYFKENGWLPNQPIAYPASVYGSEYQRLANTNEKDPKPRLPLAEYAQFNIVPEDKNILKRNKDLAATYVVLKDIKGNPEHWLTLQNFYVITRYNKSTNYAMAVFQLSEQIRALKNKNSN